MTKTADFHPTKNLLKKFAFGRYHFCNIYQWYDNWQREGTDCPSCGRSKLQECFKNTVHCRAEILHLSACLGFTKLQLIGNPNSGVLSFASLLALGCRPSSSLRQHHWCDGTCHQLPRFHDTGNTANMIAAAHCLSCFVYLLGLSE